MPDSPTEVFHRLLAGITGQRWAELPDLYAEDTVVEQPFTPGGGTVLRGREALRAHFAAAPSLGITMTAHDVVTHQATDDPEVVTAEFTYHGTVEGTGATFTTRNVIVMRVRDGLIVESHDYHDHHALAAALHPVPSQ